MEIEIIIYASKAKETYKEKQTKFYKAIQDCFHCGFVLDTEGTTTIRSNNIGKDYCQMFINFLDSYKYEYKAEIKEVTRIDKTEERE